jgi:hypothetical protein
MSIAAIISAANRSSQILRIIRSPQIEVELLPSD